MVTASATSVDDKPNSLARRLSDYAAVTAERIVKFTEELLAGGIAGAISKTVIAPGDRVKILYQVDPNRQFTLGKALKTGKRIVETGGVLALWTGNGATMLRIVPYASTTFFCFDRYHKSLKSLFGVPSSEQKREGATSSHGAEVTARFLAGSFAGATATTITYPLDLMRARFAAHWDPLHPRYPSYFMAFREIARDEGWRMLYRGLLPTLAGIMPYAGSSFACFETFKASLVEYQKLKSEKDIPVYQRLGAGSLAGLVAQSLTYPLDIVRRRMQVSPGKYRSVGQALVSIYRAEGLAQGLYKGLAMNWIKGPIAVSTSFTVNDLVKTRIKEFHEVEEDPALNSGHHTLSHGRVLSTWEKCLCGGVAGTIAKLWSAPLDRMKIMYAVGQAQGDEHTWGRDGLRRMVELYRETPHMWQGSGAMMVRVVPLAAITYASVDWFEGLAQRVSFSHESNAMTHLLGGAMAGGVATVCVHPLDLLRVRNASFMDGTRYASYRQGLAELIRGGPRSLAEGLTPAVLGIAPMAGISFACYYEFKRRFECETFAERLVAGTASGLVAQGMTYPLNVVRRRAQVEHAVETSVFKSLQNMATHQGFYAGMYHRMPLGWVFGPVTVGISFAVNDQCRDAMANVRKMAEGRHWSTLGTLLPLSW